MLCFVDVADESGGSAGREGYLARNAIVLELFMMRGSGLGGFRICE